MGAAVLVLASGCGGKAENPVAEAARRTLAASGYGVSFSSAIRVVDSDIRPLQFSGQGFVDNRRRRTRMVVSGAYEGEEIVDAARSTTLYLRFPALARQLKAARPWLRLDVTKRLWRSHFNPGALVMTLGNPAQYVGALGRSTAMPLKVGAAVYRTTISVGGRSLPARVSVGGGRLRQLRLVYGVRVPGSKTRLAYDSTIRYAAFGARPPIALPAAGDVARIGADGKLEQ